MDANHSLLIGHISGMLTRPEFMSLSPQEIKILYDEHGNYSNQIQIKRQSGTYLLKVEKISDAA